MISRPHGPIVSALRVPLLLLGAFAGLLAPGCGGTSSSQDSNGGAIGIAGGSNTAGASTGSSGQGVDAAGGNPSPDPCVGACKDSGMRPAPLPRPQCPLLEPTVDAACSEADLRCSYGDAPTPRCRDYYRCSAGKWALDSSAAYPCVTALQCPSAPDPGGACVIEVPGLPCAYTGLLCFCEASSDPAPGAAGHWGCYGPPVNSACPAQLPNLGEGCETQALECHYASNGCTAPPNSTVFCRGGAWEEGQELLCHSK
jgi:hypothetical protein